MVYPDLNLLLYLHVVIKHGNLSRAAEALNVTQPAVSAALGRLKKILNDPLFIKSGRVLIPTPMALSLYEQTQVSVNLWMQINQSQSQHPISKRLFSIMASDYVQMMLIPHVLEALQERAPEVTLRIVPSNPFRRLQMVSTREIDLAIGYYHLAPEGLKVRGLYKETMVCIMRQGHPAMIHENALSMDSWLSYRHIVVRSVSNGSYAEDMEKTLQIQAVQRQVALTIPSYVAAARMVEYTDYICVLPRSLAKLLSLSFAIQLSPVPTTLPQLDISMFYHESAQEDVSHSWFRSLVVETSLGLMS